MPGYLFYCGRSVCHGEHLADLLHLPTYQLLREFRIVPRHIRIGVPQNLRQHIYRHPIFHRKAGKCMPCAVGGLFFVQPADRGDLGHISVHFLIARYGQEFAGFYAMQVERIFL